MLRFLIPLLICAWAGSAMAFPVKRCVNLSNALEANGPEGWWGYRIKEAHLRKIAEAGFDTVRLPVRFTQDWDGRIDPKRLARVDEVVRQARAVGLRVIIDLHHFEEMMSDPEGHVHIFHAIWDELAAHFADADDGVIFELLNEPVNRLTTELASEYYAQALERIRKDNPTRWVILGGSLSSNIHEMRRLPPGGPYVAHTFHYYGPFEFTHQQLDWIDPILPPKYWGSEAEIWQVEEHLSLLDGHHTPMFLGEFGVSAKAPTAARAAWLRMMRTGAEDRGIGWCVWGFAAGFAIYDASADIWDIDALRALIPR